MNYPECPEGRDDCRFTEGGASTTCLHSPIVRDRSGKPVGGGCNRIAMSVSCSVCNKQWISSASELQDAQGVDRFWIKLK